jgi:hypothetical protein
VTETQRRGDQSEAARVRDSGGTGLEAQTAELNLGWGFFFLDI